MIRVLDACIWKGPDNSSPTCIGDEAHSHKWDDLGSLEVSASFASFLEASFLPFFDSGSARLFCFFEVALAILLMSSSVAEAEER